MKSKISLDHLVASGWVPAVILFMFLLSFFMMGAAQAQTVTVTIPAQTIQVEVPDVLPVHEHALPEHVHEYAPVPPLVDPVDPAVGQAHLSWTMPTTREDGFPLAPEEIAGYKIFYDCTNGYANTIDTANYADPLALEYTTNTMPVGETCGFEVVTYDTGGLESVRSNRVEKVIQ